MKNTKFTKKIVALVLCMTMIFSVGVAGTVSASAVEKSSITECIGKIKTVGEKLKTTVDTIKRYNEYNDAQTAAKKIFYATVSDAFQKLLAAVNKIIPMPLSFTDIDDYKSDNFYKGHKTQLTEPAEGAKWRLGYANASVIPADYKSGKYYTGASAIPIKATEVIDDMKIRVVCVDDNSGRGAVVMCVLDCIGISSTDVRKIREQVADFAKKNNIVSINVSATHSHSCIDTQGTGGVIFSMLLNPIKNAIAPELPAYTSRKPSFMNNLYKVAGDAIERAYNNMEDGELYYSSVDAGKCFCDKVEPASCIQDIAALRFEPVNKEHRGTYLINMADHLTQVTHTKNSRITSDYAYYMEQDFDKAGFNMIFFQSACGAVSSKGVPNDSFQWDISDFDVDYEKTDIPSMKAMARTFTNLVLGAESEEKLAPVLNARHEEFKIQNIANWVVVLALKTEALNNMIFRTDENENGMVYVTEMGYIEFGRRIAFGMVPGELYPDVVIGGNSTKENSLTNTDWEGTPMVDYVEDGIILRAVSFANDTVGYIIPENNWMLIVNEKMIQTGEKESGFGFYPDALMSAGGDIAKTITDEFNHVVNSWNYNTCAIADNK